MSNFEKLYTVDDIAKMTLLTTRTIRTYLKDGLLVGRKVGGQWRFTKEDINKLFENSAVSKQINDSYRQDILDFIDGVNTDITGDMQTCSVVDYYCSEHAKAHELFEKIKTTALTINSNNRFYYEYIESQQKARYTFFGTPSFIISAMEVIELEWNIIYRGHQLFNKKAFNYTKFRPSYPEEVTELILSLSNSNNINIADIGSGTGKLSSLLIKNNTYVFAIEPNSDMRSIAEKELGKYNNYISLNGSAEATTLDSDTIDIITVAEAYHWFDNEQTKLEFKRILKKDGFVILMWNNFGGNPYDDEISQINKRWCPLYKEKTNRTPREKRAVGLFGNDNYKKEEYDNTINQTIEAFIGGTLSASYALKEDDADFNKYIEDIKNIMNKHINNGLIETKITTVCYYGKL